MRDSAIIICDLDGAAAGEMRPPRIIAPLQHIFDPVIGAAELCGQISRWGASQVSLSLFSDFPRIVFTRLPAIPENLAEAMLYRLQLRLIDSALFIRHNLPGFTFGPPLLDEGVTILPA